MWYFFKYWYFVFFNRFLIFYLRIKFLLFVNLVWNVVMLCILFSISVVVNYLYLWYSVLWLCVVFRGILDVYCISFYFFFFGFE